MRTRILLTPSNNALIYQPDAEHVHIECNGTFETYLPDLKQSKEREFIFYNVGTGVVTVNCVSGQFLANDDSYHDLNPGDSVSFVSNMVDKWLISDVNVYEIAGAAGIVQENLDAHEALTTTAHGGIVSNTDARLSDARVPTAHASTHATGGSDPVSAASIGAAPLIHGVTSGNVPRATSSTAFGDGLAKDNGTRYLIGGDTNRTEFDTTGHQTMYGTARPWRDQLGDTLALRQNGTGVSFNTSENTVDFNTVANLSDYIYGNYQLNHDRDLTSDIKFHVHWLQAQNNIPNFLIKYRWQILGVAKTTAWTNLKCNTNAFTYTSGTIHQISYAAAITPPIGTSLSDVIQIQFFRDNNNASGVFSGADPYTVDVGILFIDCHFQINSIGSNDEYVK